MKSSHPFNVALIACAVGLVVACSGKTGGGGTGGGSSGGGSSGGSSGSGGSNSACDDYFQALFGGSCTGTTPPPATEIARIQTRFDTVCEAVLALPGVGITQSGLEACLSAIKSDGCSVINEATGPCSFDAGSLTQGAACVDDSQCSSGDCSAGTEASDGGTQLCGTCNVTAAVGAACGNGTNCGPGAVCAGEDGAQTCTAVTAGAAGAACIGNEVQCNAGLVCNSLTEQCASPGPAGAACNQDGDCAFPLVCPAVTGASTCQSPGAAGAPCADDEDCTSPLGCDLSTQKCAAITFVAAGQACSTTARCLVGDCGGSNGSGTCPTVIPDGQPCSNSDQSSTCDTFATCEGGTCVLGYPSCP